MPKIDGRPGAPPDQATPWAVPDAVRTPPPPAAPPDVPRASEALRADSAADAHIRMLTLTDVVDFALRNNPATRESWATARAAVEEYGSARGTLFPSLNANITASRTSGSASGIGGTGGTTVINSPDTTGGRTGNPTASGSSTVTRTQISPSISLSYLVFDFGGRAGTIESARQRAIANDLAHNATVLDVILQAQSTLFSFVATRALRDAERVAVTEAQADTAAAEARLRVGVGTLAEVLQTRTALAQARLQLATFDGSLLTARANLAAAMGFQANARFDIPTLVATDSVSMVAATVDTLINRAITTRPDLAEARANAAALAAEIRVARSAGYPALTLNTVENYTHQLQGSTATSRNQSLVLGLQIPIFNGFSRQYDVRAARDLYEAGLARVTQTQLQVTTQVFTSYAAVQTATERVGAAMELLRSAQQSSDVALGRYREGVGTIVDVLLARSALASARADEIQARWEWQTALAQLAHDTGLLDTRGVPNIPLVNRR